MSIFPVKIKDWYYNPDSAFYDKRELLETIMPSLRCKVCGKPITKSGYVYHAITFGFSDDAWCSLKCLRGDK